jgi:uncharacterized membrane protein YagU involved in acid resistance
MDIPAMVSAMMGATLALGWIAHIALGVAIYPLLYAFLACRFLPGPPVIRGALWGIVLWVGVEVMVMPMAGNGFFSSTHGGVKAVAVALLGHLIYGASLGAIAGKGNGVGPR